MNYTMEEIHGRICNTLQGFSDTLIKSAQSLSDALNSYRPDPQAAQKLRKAWRRRLYIRKYKARGKRK